MEKTDFTPKPDPDRVPYRMAYTCVDEDACDCPRSQVKDPLREELDDYIEEKEAQAPLTIYQVETALRNLENNRRATTDPLLGGKRQTLNQSIVYFKELLRVKREALGAIAPVPQETRQ